MIKLQSIKKGYENFARNASLINRIPLKFYSRCLLAVVAVVGLPGLATAATGLQLTAEQIKNWRVDGPTAVASNVSRVPLSPRVTAVSRAFRTQNMSRQFRVMWVPDGMPRLAPNVGDSTRFNQFNFTHWSYIDSFIWFSNDQEYVAALPTVNWVDAAHRNGVRVMASLMFGGGTDPQPLMSMLQRDGSGNFVAAEKLLRMAVYYGFDGYYVNQEAGGTSSETARLFRNFMRQLTARAQSKGKQVVFYDSMDADGGRPAYINALNGKNSMYLQEGGQRVSSAMFTNYWWRGTDELNASHSTALNLGRSPTKAVYAGIDMWPGRSAGQGPVNPAPLNKIFSQGVGAPLTSAGMFAANLTFDASRPLGGNRFRSDPSDVLNFYRNESVLFEGSNVNAADRSDGWKGLSGYMAPRTAIIKLPFETNFNTGHGLIDAHRGFKITKSWRDLSRQDIQPTWQWFRIGADGLRAQYDFSDAYQGGSSVKFQGHITAGKPVTYQLFASRLKVESGTQMEITYKRPINASAGMSVRLTLEGGSTVDFPLTASRAGQWQTHSIDLVGYAGYVIRGIGVTFPATVSQERYQLNLGRIRLGAALSDSLTAARMVREAELEERLELRSLPEAGQVAVAVDQHASSVAKVTLLDGDGAALATGQALGGEPLLMSVRSFGSHIRNVRVEMPDGSVTTEFRY